MEHLMSSSNKTKQKEHFLNSTFEGAVDELKKLLHVLTLSETPELATIIFTSSTITLLSVLRVYVNNSYQLSQSQFDELVSSIYKIGETKDVDFIKLMSSIDTVEQFKAKTQLN